MLKKKLSIVLLVTLLFTFIPFVNPVNAEAADDFTVGAKAAFAIEADTGKILYNQNGDEPLGIASITKLLSMYLVREKIEEGSLNWEDRVNVSEYAVNLSNEPEFSNVPLHAGSTYSVKELYHASLIESANAAVVALAEHISGSEHAFIELMRKQLEKWGITDATIVTSSGLSNGDIGEANSYPGYPAEQENTMSAKDVAIMSDHFIKDYPDVLDVTKITTEVFAPGTPSEMEMVNWNYMLPDHLNYKEGVDGLKTGTTDFAGACFAGTMVKNGVRVITVVLKADNAENDAGARYTQTSNLMDYCYNNWSQQEIKTAGMKVPQHDSLGVPEGKTMSVPVSLKDNVTFWVRKGMDTSNLTITPELDKSMVTDNNLDAPVRKGLVVGSATIQLKDEDLGYVGKAPEVKTHIVTTKSVEKANIFVRIWRNIKDFFSNLFSGFILFE